MIDIGIFQERVYTYFRSHYREMPWRYIHDPYKILVSEIMLQQTQVERVIPKFLEFIQAFPTALSLSSATPIDVLSHWQGLGYNRRGLFLKRAAEMLVEKFDNVLPRDPLLVDELPGVGYATACAVVTYSYNLPTVFIETNIRTVFIHEFFPERSDVHDKELLPLIEMSLDRENPRDWYYALMDYGVMLKKEHGNASVRSKHYTKQSRFQGSDRQLRGKILKYLLKNPDANESSLILLDSDSTKVTRVVEGMLKDKLLVRDGETLSITQE